MKPLDLPAAALHELTSLKDHMLACAEARSPLHWLRCLGEVVDEFLAPRFVTTLALTIMVLAGTSLAA